MSSPFCIDQGMQLVEDHSFCRGKHILAGFAGQHQVERFGRGDQDVRGFPYHPLPFAGGGIARADIDCDAVFRSYPGERALQIFTDVCSLGFQRRDIDKPELRF